MINFHINKKEVDSLSAEKGIDRLTAIAILAGKQYGIKPHEEVEYMRLFHKYMAEGKSHLTAIDTALVDIALNDNFMKSTVDMCCFYNHSLN